MALPEIKNIYYQEDLKGKKWKESTFSGWEKVYDKLKDKNKIDKEVFVWLYNKYYNKLSDKNKDILRKMKENNFFDKKMYWEFLIATLLFLNKNWEKLQKKIIIFSKKSQF